MTGMNCNFEGRVAGTPKAGMTKSGKSQVVMTVAYDEFNNESKICRVNAYGEQAIAVARSLAPGDEVRVAGALFANTWEKDGVQKAGIMINANHIEPLSHPQRTDMPPF